MSVFAIIAHTSPDLVGAKVKSLYPDAYTFPPSAWFVADSVTTMEMRAKLGLDSGQLGAQAVIVQVGGWAGYGPADMWEWFKTKFESKTNG